MAEPGAPYVKHGDDFRSLENEDELFSADLEHALRLFSEPKKSRRRQAAKKVIAAIARPEGTPLQVLEGRYGPYVTDGETNASVPKGVDPTALTLEAAIDLLEARRSAPPREGRGRSGAGRGRKKAAPAGVKVAKAKSAKAPKASTTEKPTRARKVAVSS